MRTPTEEMGGGGGVRAKAAGVVLSPPSPGFPGPFVRKEFVEFLLLKKKVSSPYHTRAGRGRAASTPGVTSGPATFALCPLPGVAMVLPRPGAGAQALGEPPAPTEHPQPG